VSGWRELVTASLIGAERAVVPAPDIPGLPAGERALPPSAGEAGAGDPAAALLASAALLTTARRAGRRPDHAEPLPAAGQDPRPLVSHAAGQRLTRMLAGEYRYLVSEWLTAAAERGLRPPPQLLPALLDGARRGQPATRQLVAAAGGPRVRWLAGLNPEWVFAAQQAGPDDPQDPDVWRHGSAARRRDYLAALRARDPAAARELVREAWDGASTQERLWSLAVLAGAVTLADEPLLEAALDDRSTEVSGRAAEMLARLPGSALSRRLAARAGPCLRVRYGRSGRVLAAQPPDGDEASLARDGVLAAPPARGAPADRRARLLLELVARTPLRTWTRRFGRPAADLVAMARDAYWSPVLFAAWSRAAIAQQDQEWLTALTAHALAGRTGGTAAETQIVRQLSRHADPAMGAPHTWPEPGPDTPPAVYAALETLRFRYDMLKELDDGR